jgi:hypothetical protein
VLDLPIADYDDLKVNEILPLLDDLDLDELEAVAQHEESNKNRTTVLNRIDDRMDELEAAEAGAPTTVQDAVATSDEVAEAAAETIETVGEPVVATAGAAASLPIAGYDGLSEAEAIAALQSLDADELEAVADYEEANENRDAVLDAIDDRLDVLEGIVPAPAAAAAAPAPVAKKSPAKKAPARKAVAVTGSAKKATTTSAKKAAAAPAKKATTKAATPAPAKKSAAKATTAAKSTAKKAAAKKAAAPAAKATTAAKSTAKKTAATPKKAAPVKKATAAKKATKR